MFAFVQNNIDESVLMKGILILKEMIDGDFLFGFI